jgi:hydrogenase 3 maturation protease
MRGMIIGIGNEMRGDDGIGMVVAEALKAFLPYPVILAGEVPENYLDIIRSYGPDWILLVDAVDFGGDPGDTILIRFNDEAGEPPVVLSTHRPSLRILRAYIKKEVGAELFLLGIQPKVVGFCLSISDEVRDAVDKAIKAAISFVDGIEALSNFEEV